MSFFQSKSITAKLVGPNLVAAFPTANPPLIWKFDLDRNHSFTVCMQGEINDWELGVTSPKGEFYPVAHFPLKEDAEQAMAKVQKVLMQKRRSKFWSFMRWAFGLLLFAVLATVIWIVLQPTLPASLSSTNNGLMRLPPVTSMPAAPVIRPGVPQSADDVLQPPK